jgi:uncharacterized protein (DUF2461 family)
LYRNFGSRPSSFAQAFDACRELLNQRPQTVSKTRTGLADLVNTLEQMFESVGGFLYRQAYGTK